MSHSNSHSNSYSNSYSKSFPKIYQKHLDSIHLQNILNRTKVVEGRPYHNVVQLKVGDIIYFLSNNKDGTKACTQITGLTKYNSFREMLEAEKIHRVLPNVRTVEEGLNIYLEPTGYYTKDDEKDGVIAITIDLIDL